MVNSKIKENNGEYYFETKIKTLEQVRDLYWAEMNHRHPTIMKEQLSLWCYVEDGDKTTLIDLKGMRDPLSLRKRIIENKNSNLAFGMSVLGMSDIKLKPRWDYIGDYELVGFSNEPINYNTTLPIVKRKNE